MSTNETGWLGILEQIEEGIAGLGRKPDPRPGANLNVRVTLPAPADQDEQEALKAAVLTALERANRVWWADIVYQTGDKPIVEVDLADPAVARQSDRPILELRVQGPEGAILVCRRELHQGTVYALMRQGLKPPPDGVSSLDVGSALIPREPQVLFESYGSDVWARVPEPGQNVSLVSDAGTTSLGTSWVRLPVDSATGSPGGSLFLTVRSSSVLVHFRVLPVGTRATRFKGLLSADVRVTRRTVKDDRGRERFQKTYECETADDAAALKDHFLAQRTLVQAVNATVRAANTEKGVARNGIEETTVRRGAAPGYLVTEVLPSVSPEARAATTTPPVNPVMQADHRIFVQSPYLRPFPADPGRIARLPEFLPMARALDELHRIGAVHGDVKPQNTCFAQAMPANSQISIRWAVLVDTEGLAAPEGDVLWTGLHTPRFTHPAFAESEDPPLLDHLIANDRVGFAAVVVAAVLGSGVDPTGPQGATERRARLAAALNQTWTREATDRVLTVLEAPFEQESQRLAQGAEAWSCAGWVRRLIEVTDAAETEPSVKHLVPLDDVGRTIEDLRRIYAREARTRRQEAVEAGLADAAYALARRTFHRWFWGGFAVLAGLVVVALVILLLGGHK